MGKVLLSGLQVPRAEDPDVAGIAGAREKPA